MAVVAAEVAVVAVVGVVVVVAVVVDDVGTGLSSGAVYLLTRKSGNMFQVGIFFFPAKFTQNLKVA